MKNDHSGPGAKQGPGKENASLTGSNPGKRGDYPGNRPGKDRSKNYKEGDNGTNGPNWNKKSEQEDGDTSVNAGVFK